MAKKSSYIVFETPKYENTYDPATASKYVNSLEIIKKHRRRKKMTQIFAGVAIMAGLSAGLFFVFLNPFQSENINLKNSANNSSQNPSEPKSPTLKKLNSQKMGISFNYPTDWTVKIPSEKEIYVESPIIKLADVNNNFSDAKIELAFISNDKNLSEAKLEDYISVADSVILNYASPSSDQRAKTYISFGGAGRSGLSTVMATGDRQYLKTQLIPASELEMSDLVIMSRFYSCADATCAMAQRTRYSISPEEWYSNEIFQQLQEMIASLEIK